VHYLGLFPSTSINTDIDVGTYRAHVPEAFLSNRYFKGWDILN
jgi:hypothetical protein